MIMKFFLISIAPNVGENIQQISMCLGKFCSWHTVNIALEIYAIYTLSCVGNKQKK